MAAAHSANKKKIMQFNKSDARADEFDLEDLPGLVTDEY